MVFTDWYLPGYKAGGPIRSVSNFTARFQHDFEIYVVTSNRDFNEKDHYKDIVPNEWIQREQYSIIYLDEQHTRFTYLKGFIKEINPEWFYFNSLFSVSFTLLPLIIARYSPLKGKVLLAPRGMLGEGALQIKGFKKTLFIGLSKLGGIFSNIKWHATSEQERKEILKVFPDANVLVASNFPDAKEFPSFQPKKKEINQLKLFFLSRISEKKNLHFALKILTQIPEPIAVEFDIFGPVEDQEYWKKCQKEINRLQSKKNIQVRVLGEVPNDALFSFIKSHHTFLLPTLNENYGHAIVEAFKNGSPVIISNKTPWRGLAGKKAGFDISLQDEEKFKEAIELFAEMDEITFNKWSEGAFQLAKEIVEEEEELQMKYKSLFNPQ